MKKTVLSVVFVALAFTASWSQLSLGVKAGLNLSDQTFSGGGYTTSPDFRVGILMGGYARLKLNSNFDIQPELYFSMQGAKSGSITYKADYINVPILFRWNITDNFNLHAGPQFGLLLTGKQITSTAYSDYKTLDVGAVLGLGIELPMNFNVGFRTVIGLADINNSSVSSSTVHNFVIQAFVGYTLFGGK